MKPPKITLRLAAAFALLAGVLLVVGWLGISHLRQLNAQMQYGIYARWKEELLSHEAYRLASQNSQIMLLIFSEDNSNAVQKLVAQRTANTQHVTQLIADIKPLVDTKEEKPLFATVETTRPPYLKSYDEALALLLVEHQPAEARRMMVETVQPNLVAYQDAWDAFNRYEVQEIEQAMQQSRIEYGTGERDLLLTLAMAGLITGAIAIFTLRHTGREIGIKNRAEQVLQTAHKELEGRVAERTRELQHSNEALQLEMTERKLAHEQLQWQTAFLEAQVDSSIDGILVVDPHGQKILQNQRFVEICDMPQRIADDRDDERQLQWFTDLIKNPVPFLAQVEYLYRHPNEVSRDEIELKNGKVLDRYSAPVLGKDGKRYGRIWTLRDITAQKQIEAALQRQKEELRVLFDLIPAMIWFKDTHNHVLRINKLVADTAGKTVEEIEGKPSSENYPEQAAKFYADDLEVIQSGVPKLGIVETMRNREGQEIWVQTDKVPYRDKDGRVVGIVVMAQDITNRNKAEESLRLLSSAVEQSKESILITEANLDWPGPKIIFVNPAFTKMTGYSAEEALGETPRILQGPRTDKAVLRRLRQNLEQGEVFAGEAINYRKDGTEFNMEWQIAAIRDSAGTIKHFVAIQHDITERKRLENQLFQSQKLETVGKLAGGVAHEFNNIMTAIIGQSELMLADLPSGNHLRKNATEINQAALRAATLTRQLLAYGRKQVLRPASLKLNTILTNMEGGLRHLLGRAVDFHLALAAGLKAVKADAGQIEQVIMNLVMNAKDAMPKGGKLTIETTNLTLGQDYVERFPEMKEGEYVMLAVTDTGLGMSDTVKAHAFEPFFTTKGVGEGTGLGLSTCYGIVKQSGGHISVYSEAGVGTTFKVYLPIADQETKSPLPPPNHPHLPPGTETILLVEDEPALRELAETLLSRLGYTVLAAANGREALSLQKQHTGKPIDLLFTDVVMPQMNGKELSDQVQALSPQTKVLFTSAFTENAITHRGMLNQGVALLQKPFTPSALANKVREVLGQPGNPLLALVPEAKLQGV